MHGDPTELAERLRSAIAGTVVPVPAGAVQVTASIGLAELKPDDDLTTLLARADEVPIPSQESRT
jgi:PleD family two-component response regulator